MPRTVAGADQEGQGNRGALVPMDGALNGPPSTPDLIGSPRPLLARHNSHAKHDGRSLRSTRWGEASNPCALRAVPLRSLAEPDPACLHRVCLSWQSRNFGSNGRRNGIDPGNGRNQGR